MYQFAAYLHLLAAMVWFGGMVFVALVLVPVARSMQQPPGAGARFLSAAARRFRVAGWVALLALVGTGLWLLVERDVGAGDIASGDGWFYQSLRVKLGFVALVLVLSAVHDFVIGPRLARRLEAVRGPSSGDPSLARQRRVVSWLARVNLALALAIIASAVVLVRGIPGFLK